MAGRSGKEACVVVKKMPVPDKVYDAVVVRVVDGDTVVLRVDVGFHIYTEVVCRLRGVYAPEMDSLVGKDCRDKLVEMLPSSTSCVVKTYKTERYGRWLAEVWTDDLFVNEDIKQYIYKKLGE